MAGAKSRRGIETESVHGGDLGERFGRAVVMPTFQSTTYAMGSGESAYHDILYARLSNSPNHLSLGQTLARLEGSEAGLVTSSGMAAVTTTLLTLLRPGDHLIAQECLYGATHEFITSELAALGVSHSFVSGDEPEAWQPALRPNTKVFYCETLTNPLLELADLPAIASFASENQLISVVDNTFASPVQFRPIEHGFDVVLHSATKYLNGHSDVIAGAVCGKSEQLAAIKHKLDLLGGSLDAHACFLLQRGLKTLALRVRHQAASALSLATALETHSAVRSVRYPGLASHPHHARARELLDGFGGMLAVELAGGRDAAEAMFARLELGVDAPSLGGPETLLTRPARTSHAGLSPQAREALGIREGLVRISVGLESAPDLIADFAQALA